MIKSYRLTRKPHRYWVCQIDIVNCERCKSEVKGFKKRSENGVLCPPCRKIIREMDSGLNTKQQTFMKYLLAIVEKQSELKMRRRLSKSSGGSGLLIDTDEEALEWTILEYRRKRMTHLLGLENHPRLNNARRKAKKALGILAEFYTLSFKMQGERIDDIMIG